MFPCKLGYIVTASPAVLLIALGGLEFSEFAHDPQHACSRYLLPLSAILRSRSWQLRGNPAIRRSGALCLWCLHEECQSLLPEKVMASGKNGGDGDLLLFRDGPGACDISTRALRLFISWECPRSVAGVQHRPAANPLLRQWELPTVPYLDTNGVVPLVIYLRGLDVNHRAWFAHLYQLPGPNSEQSPAVARPGSLGHALDSCRGHNVKSSTTFYA
ncbi:hypothetical protein Tco_0581394 [Tanacetum coccineum]